MRGREEEREGRGREGRKGRGGREGRRKRGRGGGKKDIEPLRAFAYVLMQMHVMGRRNRTHNFSLMNKILFLKRKCN